MYYNIIYNNNNNRHYLDIIKKNTIETELIITYNTENKREMEKLVKFLRMNKFIFMHIDRKEGKLEFSTIKKHAKSKVYVIKEIMPSQYFKELDEMYLYVTLIKSYKSSINI